VILRVTTAPPPTAANIDARRRRRRRQAGKQKEARRKSQQAGILRPGATSAAVPALTMEEEVKKKTGTRGVTQTWRMMLEGHVRTHLNESEHGILASLHVCTHLTAA
jgi:hypothetical protein